MKLQHSVYFGIFGAVIIIAALFAVFALRGGSRKAPSPLEESPAQSRRAAQVHGSALDPEAIRAGIQAVMTEMKSCYETMMDATGSRASGSATIRCKIVGKDGRGQIEDAEIVETTFLNPLFSNCVIEAMQKAKFPAPKGNGVVEVTYPFTFTSTED